MSKISKRRQPHGQQAPRAEFSQARKVSFEEGSHYSSSSLKSSHSSCATLIPRTSPCSNMLLMSTLLERKPTPTTTCLSEMASNDESEEEHDFTEICTRTVSKEEEDDDDDCMTTSPWGQFVDVIPHDHDVTWTPTYDPPVLHSSPAYHPYNMMKNHPSKSITAGLSSIPNKKSTTRKLQQRRVLQDVEGAFEQLRF